MFDRMADNDSKLPEKISDALNTIEEFTGVNVPKVVAYKAGAAYLSQQAAALSLTGLVALGGPASTISQEQTRRPDENLPTQNRGNAEPMRSLLVAASTSGSSVLTGSEMRFGQDIVSYVVFVPETSQEDSKTRQTPQVNADGEGSKAPKSS
jgi:hypothetical protein